MKHPAYIGYLIGCGFIAILYVVERVAGLMKSAFHSSSSKYDYGIR